MMINTSRLHIRHLCAEDWIEMKEIFSDFRQSSYAMYDAPLPTEEVEIQELTRRFAASNLFFSVDLKNKMIGYLCFHAENVRYDLGYCFHSAHHGNGYAYESAHALIQYFAQEYNARVFTAGTAIDNTPSCNLLKKLGFICVSTETVSFNADFSFTGGNFVLDLERLNPCVGG